MTVKKINNLPEAYPLKDAIGKIFNESIWDPFNLTEKNWQLDFPSIDVENKGDSLLVKADVPGMNPEKINLEIEDDYLIISGAEEQVEKKETQKMYREERYKGSFRREVMLPCAVDPQGIKAKIKDGVLKIELPKIKKEKIQKIQIEKE